MNQPIYLDEISPFRYRYSRNDPEASSGQVQVHVIMNNVKQSLGTAVSSSDPDFSSGLYRELI